MTNLLNIPKNGGHLENGLWSWYSRRKYNNKYTNYTNFYGGIHTFCSMLRFAWMSWSNMASLLEGGTSLRPGDAALSHVAGRLDPPDRCGCCNTHAFTPASCKRLQAAQTTRGPEWDEQDDAKNTPVLTGTGRDWRVEVERKTQEFLCVVLFWPGVLWGRWDVFWNTSRFYCTEQFNH